MKTQSSLLSVLLAGIPCIASAVATESNASSQDVSPEIEKIEQNVREEAVTDSLATYDMLDDLVVEAVRPVIKSDGATTTFSVDEDPSSKGQTVLEVLRRVPGVTVDGQDNILVQGKSDYKIYVNGREEPMLSQNASQILKSMPASAISKIEVMTDPGAKFDAEGTAGILNLVTERKQSKDGYSGNVSASGSVADYNTAAFVTGKINKVTASANIVYAGNNGLERRSLQEGIYEYAGGEKLREIHHQKPNYNLGQGGYKVSWEPDSRNLFTTSLDVTLMRAKIKDNRQHNLMTASDGSTIWESEQTVGAVINRSSINADLSYQHNFDDAGHLIVGSYAFNYSDNGMDFNWFYSMQDGVSNPWATRSSSADITRQHTAQIDYTNPFKSDRHKLEAGIKGIFRRNSGYGRQSTALNEGDPFINNPSFETSVSQFQDILAAYASYSFTSEKWSARAGVRYENTRMGIKSHDSNSIDFTSRLNDVVPNASVTYSFGPASNIRLAYSMRISRPTIEQVNPFRKELGNKIQFGNPDLSSERLNTVSLTYTSFGRVVGGNIGVEYSNTSNSIETIMGVDGINRTETYMNSGTNRAFRINGFFNWSIMNNMSLSLGGDAEYKDMRAPGLGYKNSGWSGNLNANWNWRLDNVANFGAFGGWGGRSILLQGTASSWNYYGVSVGRDFLKGKNLNVTLNAMSFIKPVKSYKNIQKTEGLNTTNIWTSNQWRIGVSVTWSFGSLHTNVKETAADLSTDDIKASNNNNQQGGMGI